MTLLADEPRFVLTQKGEDAVTAAMEAPIDTLVLDELWQRIEEKQSEIRKLYQEKDVLEAELYRRMEKDHPEFTAESGIPSVDLTGEGMLLHVTYDRTYAYRNERVMELQRLSVERPNVLSPAEFEELVAWEPKVSGTIFNKLYRRGGLLADLLNATRFLQRSKPKFEAKARAG